MTPELVIDPRREKESNRNYAYHVLRKNIMIFRMPPGTPINEGEWAKRLNMSRTPIHEAVKALESEWLVDVMPQSGTRVSKINLQAVKEGNELRRLVEVDMLRRYAGRVPSEDLKRMKSLLDEQKYYAEQKGVNCQDLFLKLDDEFHECIYMIANQPRIWRCVKGANTDFDRIRYAEAVLNQTDLELFYEAHRKMYRILLMGMHSGFDLEGFYTDHLGGYRIHFDRLLEEFPDYFEY